MFYISFYRNIVFIGDLLYNTTILREASKMVQKKPVLFTYFFLAFFCTFSISLFTYWESNNSNNTIANSKHLDSSWNIVVNNTAFNNKTLSSFDIPFLPEESTLRLNNTLPFNTYSQPVLWVQTIYSTIKVFIDGKNVYSYGQNLKEQKLNVGSGFHIIPLTKEDQGKSLVISLVTTQNNAFSVISPIFVQPSSIVFPSFIKRNLLSFFSSIFMIILGVVGTFVCFGAFFLKKKMYALLALSQFSLWIGIGVLTNTNLIQLFSNNLTLNSYLEYLALYVTPLSLILLFLVNIAQTKLEKTVSFSLLVSFSLFCGISLILDHLRFIRLPDTLTLYQIICALMILFSLVISIKKIVTQNNTVFYTSLSFSFLVFFCMMDLGRYLVQKTLLTNFPLFYTSLLTIGAIIFIISELLFYFINFTHDNLPTEHPVLNSIFPRLSSRKKIIETVNELNKNNIYYSLISLSFENTNKNGSILQEYGNSVVLLLKKVFDCYGLISYYSNNNFIIVVSEVSQTKLTQLISTFNKLLQYKTLKENFPNITPNIGYVYSYEPSNKSFKAVLSLAQKRKEQKMISG